MKVKVLKTSDSMFWYSKYVGQCFDVLRTEWDRYWVREPAGFLNFVLVADSEIVLIAKEDK